MPYNPDYHGCHSRPMTDCLAKLGSNFMPVLKELSQKYGFKIIIPSNDHEPKHVHIFKGDDDYAKIEIETMKVIRCYLKPQELKQALKIIQENQEYLIKKWHEIIG